MTSDRTATAAGLLLGFAADRVLGDPRRFHPVAGFGSLAGRLERRVYAPTRPRGAAYTAVLVGGSTSIGGLAGRATRGHPILRVSLTASTTWAVLGGRSLEREATVVGRHLASGDLPGARRQVARLVGRSTADLDPADVARAAIESVAENTSDAVVAPLLAGAVGGVAGLAGYRAANTLDAMVGHRNPRYEEFGWASARLDDALNLVPSRVSALIAGLAAPAVGGRAREAYATWRRDAHRHPSPNAGPVEAAFGGALGVRLGGINVYDGHGEDRGTLGSGRPAEYPDIGRATLLAGLVGVTTAAIAAGWAVATGPERPVAH